MAIQAEVLEAEVRVRMDKAEADLRRLESRLGKTGNAAATAGAKAKKGGQGFNVMGGLVKAAAGAMAASLAKKVITAASDLNEELSKTGVVFGPAAKRVTSEADRMARQFGINKTVYLQAAGGLGLVAKASGLTQRESAKLSNRFAGLAADASSFYNVPIEDALLAMKSGLVGEAEPMRRFGVLLNEAAVGTEAMRLGLSKTGKDLTEGQKVQARSSLIIKGMADANGDLARTQGSVSNQIREAKGRIGNYAAEIGTKALPAVADFLGLLNEEAIPAVGDFAKGMLDGSGEGGKFAAALKSNVVPAIEDLVGIGKELLPFLQGAGTLVHGLLEGFQSLPGPVRSNLLLLGGMTLAFQKLNASSAMTGLTQFSADLGTAEGRAGRMTRTLQGMGGMLRNVAGAGGLMLMADAADKGSSSLGVLESAAGGALSGAALGAFGGPWGAAIGGTLGGVGGAFLALSRDTKEATKAATVGRAVWDSYVDTLSGVYAATTKATRGRVIDNLAKPENATLIRDLGVHTRVWTSAIMGNEAAQRKVTGAVYAAVTASKAKLDAQKAIEAQARAAADALTGQEPEHVQQAVIGTLRAQEKVTGELQGQFDTQQALATQRMNLLKSLGADVSLQQVKNGLLMRQRDMIKAGIPKGAARLLDTGKVKADTTAVAGLIDQFKIVKGSWKATLIAAGVPATRANIKAVQDALRVLDGTTAKPKVTIPTGPAMTSLQAIQRGLTGIKDETVMVKVFRTQAGGGAGSSSTGHYGGSADGDTITRAMGTIGGQRNPYGDKVLRWLAPGEEVLTNRRGEADRFRAMRRAGLIPGMATGGTVGRGGAAAVGSVAGGLVEAFQAGLAPATRILDKLLRVTRAATSGAREARLARMIQANQQRVTALEKRRATVTAQLAAKTTWRDDQIQKRDSFKSSVTEGIQSQANVLNAGNSASQIAANLSTQLGKAKEFAAAIATMRKMGYSDAVVQQVAGAGIEGGLEAAKALIAASSGEVSSINTSYKGITDIANQQGAQLSKDFYQAGINSAAGVIKGLTSQKAAIERTLTVIAKGMIKALRRALGIKSPSTAFFAQGEWSGKGLEEGLESRGKAVQAQSRALARRAINGAAGEMKRGKPWTSLTTATGLTPAAMSGTAAGAGVHLELNTFYPLPEPTSVTTNKGLDRVAALNLV